MLPVWLVAVASFIYLGTLFAVASFGDRRADAGRSVIGNPVVYTLSLAVYCSAWTYYGSVGVAATTGLAFLPIYLGPTLAALLFPFLLLKVLRITKTYGITSIADFLAARYGKSGLVGGLVTVVAAVGGIPYISLQLKAVAASVTVVMGDATPFAPAFSLGADTALTVTLVLAIFAIFFGARHVDVTETHQGMVLAIAFESVVKLLAFVVAGSFITYGIFDGFGDIAGRAMADERVRELFTMSGTGLSYIDWFLLTMLSGMMMLVLPRQFQVAVLENVDENHLRTASWLFPAYLLVINVFVMPVALAGLLLDGGEEGVNAADLLILRLPMDAGQEILALVTYLGGLSAATAMVIVATVALSTMVSNDLVLPVLLRRGGRHRGSHGDAGERPALTGLILNIRRATILVLLMAGYLFFKHVSGGLGLASTGLIAFAAVAQFAPAIIAAIYWRDANRTGAVLGISGGFLIWLYTLICPMLARAGAIDDGFLVEGLFGVGMLRPEALFALEGLNPVSHALVWSLSLNLLLLVTASLLGRQDNIERVQALMFVEVESSHETARLWHGQARVGDLCDLMIRFIGPGGVNRVLDIDGQRRGRRLGARDTADAEFVLLVERQLARVIGSSSARVMVASVVDGEGIGPDQVMEILDETSQVIEYSQRLEQKSKALEAATAELREANARLTELDGLKDEFIATVSHELRTPLTSIRSFSEILLDTPELPEEERSAFLAIVVRESERLTRLINDVLDLSKIEAGRMDWQMAEIDLREVIDEALDAASALFTEGGIAVETRLRLSRASIVGDRDRLVQLIVNLLANAVKFVPGENGRVCVELFDHANGWYEVRVDDNGPGVPRDFRRAIFEKFRQASEGPKERPKGTGLGLTISRHIVEAFGGRIWVETSDLGGASFRFTLRHMPAAGHSGETEPRAAE
ncbi:MAG: histidine kinase [Geminicoccaceae bacterium]|nr:histidine kinase [Geminicoccaceae bacterium]